ncbi:MAG: transporter substrate-binding domain-containing protein [Campylobacter sp.]|nr:transporter substrate-binding domain-containing protein [Campylobacter sp.]
MNKFLFTLASSALLFSGVCAKSLAEIKSSGTILIAVHDDEAPFGKLNGDKYEGFEITLAEAVAAKIFAGGEGKVEFVASANDETSYRLLQDGAVDMAVSTLVPTAESEKLADFSSPYFSVNVGILTRKADVIKSIKDLKGKTILAIPGSIGEKYFQKQGYTIKECDSAGACARALLENQGDAYADENIIVMAFPVINREVEVPQKNLGASEFNSIGVQKGNTDLLKAIDAALVELSKTGFFETEFNNHISPYYKGTAEKEYFLLDDIYNLL